ncbi:MAG: ABC transporter permease [Phycisphaerales bacterium]|nr:ABC transporter permease [Phycisphaerales bacterium]
MARLSRLFAAQEFGLVAVIVALCILLSAFGGSVQKRQRDPQTGEVRQVEVNKFFQRANLDNVLKYCSWTAVMAVGATILIIAGGIDLSIGAIYCLAAVSGALFLQAYGPTSPHGGGAAGWVTAIGIAITVAVGAACGAANGLLVVLLRVHPFIITLGTMLIFRGIAFVRTKAQAITDFPEQFGVVFRGTWLDITYFPLILMLCVVAAGFVFLRYTVAGRKNYAIGGNEVAARYSGVHVGRAKVLAYTLCGLCGGIAAVIALGVFGSADSSTGRGYELDVIAAAVVGGASLTGGRGTAIGALLGALVIQLITNGILVLEIDMNYSEIIKGVVIIVAVVLDRVSASLNERRLLRAA